MPLSDRYMNGSMTDKESVVLVNIVFIPNSFQQKYVTFVPVAVASCQKQETIERKDIKKE